MTEPARSALPGRLTTDAAMTFIAAMPARRAADPATICPGCADRGRGGSQGRAGQVRGCRHPVRMDGGATPPAQSLDIVLSVKWTVPASIRVARTVRRGKTQRTSDGGFDVRASGEEDGYFVGKLVVAVGIQPVAIGGAILVA